MKYNLFPLSFILFSLINWSCSKSGISSSLRGRYKTAEKQMFGNLVMTTKEGVINDQVFIQEFLNRARVTYFKSQGSSVQLTSSLKFNFNNQGAIINGDPSITDTATFKVKEDDFILLEYKRNGYFPSSSAGNACDIIADKVNKYPLTGSCESTGGWNNVCHHMEYYPIEFINNRLNICPFNYFVKSVRSINTFVIMCTRGEGNILSVASSGFDTSLFPGDTVVVQKTSIALVRT